MFGYDSARDKYGFTIDGLFVPFRKGAIYLGEYSANTTIDVSELGAESADEFLAVATPQNIDKTSGNAGMGANGGIARTATTYTPPTLSLVDGNLIIEVGTLYSYGGACGSWWLAVDETKNNKVKVYYVGDIETV